MHADKTSHPRPQPHQLSSAANDLETKTNDLETKITSLDIDATSAMVDRAVIDMIFLRGALYQGIAASSSIAAPHAARKLPGGAVD